MTEAAAEALVSELLCWRHAGAAVWHPDLIAVLDRAIIAVHELKVKLHIETTPMSAKWEPMSAKWKPPQLCGDRTAMLG